jgi:hypothetical protein
MSRAAQDNEQSAGKPVLVGVIADPGFPADLANSISDDMKLRLEKRSGGDPVDLRLFTKRLALDENNEMPMRTMAWRDRQENGLDYVIYLTDESVVPSKHPLIFTTDCEQKATIISLPSLGAWWLKRRTARAVEIAYAELADSEGHSSKLHRPFIRTNPERGGGQQGCSVAQAGRFGRTRLLAGIVRANQPWRLLPSLSKAFAAAVGTGGFFLINSASWQAADALQPPRLILAAVLSVLAMVVWLITVHSMWERTTDASRKSLVALYNAATVATLTTGMVMVYAGLFVTGFVAFHLVIPGSLLESTLGHPVGVGDRFAIVTFVASLATLAGALGTGFESESAVQRAAYGFRHYMRHEQRKKDEEMRREEGEVSENESQAENKSA